MRYTMPPKFIFVRHGEATHNLAFNQSKDASSQQEIQRQGIFLNNSASKKKNTIRKRRNINKKRKTRKTNNK